VQIGEVKGTVIALELLHIILANEKNESIVIPTKELSTQSIRIFGEFIPSNTKE
jgi:small-conductance mechanosensitive channel